MIYNRKYIFIGIIVFLVIFTLPFTLNIGSSAYKPPALTLPEGIENCIEPVEYMRTEHMTLLDTWRDKALRDNKREYTASDGRVWAISLQNTCMECHVDKTQFCDSCHTINSVTPYCWDCHIEPKGKP